MNFKEAALAQVIRFEQTRGLAAVRIWDANVGEPGPGQVLLQQKTSGLNYADRYFRTGIYSVPLPSGMGVEGASSCDHLIHYSDEDVAQRVRELNDGVGVSAVFDSVGKDTFKASLDSLKRRVLPVCRGTTSGTIPLFKPATPARKGSLFPTRPALANYPADPLKKQALLAEMLDYVVAGRIRIDIQKRYALPKTEQAHRDRKSRKTVGASVFTI